MIKTVKATDPEITVTGLTGKHIHLKNGGPVSVYVSTKPGIVPGADDVLRIYGGEHVVISEHNGTVYLLGSDNDVIIYTSDDIRSPF